MWQKGWRDTVFSDLERKWDLIIVGGGITGAGIFREAVNAGLDVLLLEANDFAYGTSSRSSKLIHGGVRYLRNKQYNVTFESVRERQWMLREAPKLVTPLPFLLPVYSENESSQKNTGLQLLMYDLMAPKWWHRSYSASQLLKACPYFRSENLIRGYFYGDALMDDARLVLRVIREAVRAGGTALNYAEVTNLLREKDGRVCGVLLRDRAAKAGQTCEVQARVVINATGPWSDNLRGQIGAPPRLRKLRGSHVVLPADKLPSPYYAVHLIHPRDYRTMFTFGWNGAGIAGTTDLDHDPELEQKYTEPFASHEEIAYIIEALQFTFPELRIQHEDILSTTAGLRPVVNTGKAKPSDESRAHAIWEEDGLLTITGGKYTTFRVMAAETLNHASPKLRGSPIFPTRKRMFDPLPSEISPEMEKIPNLAYLLGRYGNELQEMAAAVPLEEFEPIAGLPDCWAELRWAARTESVVHLDDLLLRRVRIGLTLRDGASGEMAKIRSIVQPELGWDDDRWNDELEYYRKIWKTYYSPSPG